MFGRSDDEWDAMVEEAIAFLTEQARLKRIVSYSELNSALGRRGHAHFDFDRESDRNAVGVILGDVTKKTIADTKVMLSAIVAYIDRNDAGPGFYSLATQLGLLPKAAATDDKLAFWANQVRTVHERYARLPRRRLGP